jgi:hypothetical protein
MRLRPGEILRSAQNDKITHFFRNLLSLRGLVLANTKIRRLKPALHHSARPAAAPEDQAHWKLNPPRWPVTSTTSPMKNNPGTRLLSMVLIDNS